MHISICTQANHATAVAPTVYDISDKNGRAGCDMHAVPQYLSVRYVTEENCFQRIVRNAADINLYSPKTRYSYFPGRLGHIYK